MPLTTLGQGYRTFSEPQFCEAVSIAQVRQIEWPTSKAFAIVADDDGLNNLCIFKFNEDSVAVDNGTTVLKPLNPAFDAVGRWIVIPISGGSSGGGGNFIGNGSPEGVVTADPAARYWDALNGANYIKETGAGTDTGWLQTYTL